MKIDSMKRTVHGSDQPIFCATSVCAGGARMSVAGVCYVTTFLMRHLTLFPGIVLFLVAGVHQMIKTPELEQALMVLPFSQVEIAAKYLVRLLTAGLEVELCARCAIFLLKVHQVCSHAWSVQGFELFRHCDVPAKVCMHFMTGTISRFALELNESSFRFTWI